MYFDHDRVEARDIGEGAVRRVLAYSPTLMVVEIEFPAGGTAAMHSHPHEQITYVVSGKVVYMAEGREDVILETGDSYYVEPGLVHGVKVLEDSRIIDVFSPMREDFL